jgi:hypothetical protein
LLRKSINSIRTEKSTDSDRFQYLRTSQGTRLKKRGNLLKKKEPLIQDSLMSSGINSGLTSNRVDREVLNPLYYGSTSKKPHIYVQNGMMKKRSSSALLENKDTYMSSSRMATF